MEMFVPLSIEVGKLFLMMAVGFVIYRLRLVTMEESKVISKLLLHIVLPCVVVHSFCVTFDHDKLRGLLLAYAAAIIITGVLIGLTALLTRPLKLTPLEAMSVIYFNTGIIVPIIASAMGQEWVLYATAMICVHTCLVWTHCKGTLAGREQVQPHRVLTNPNIIAMVIGLLLFFTQLPLPRVLSGTIESLAALFGPLSMIVTGMLVGSLSWKRMRSYRRLPLIVSLRMVGAPLVALLLLKLSHAELLVPNGTGILMISLLTVATNSGSTITQLVQVYGGDAEYSGMICAVTSVLSMVALPVFGALFQMI